MYAMYAVFNLTSGMEWCMCPVFLHLACCLWRLHNFGSFQPLQKQHKQVYAHCCSILRKTIIHGITVGWGTLIKSYDILCLIYITKVHRTRHWNYRIHLKFTLHKYPCTWHTNWYFHRDVTIIWGAVTLTNPLVAMVVFAVIGNAVTHGHDEIGIMNKLPQGMTHTIAETTGLYIVCCTLKHTCPVDTISWSYFQVVQHVYNMILRSVYSYQPSLFYYSGSIVDAVAILPFPNLWLGLDLIWNISLCMAFLVSLPILS